MRDFLESGLDFGKLTAKQKEILKYSYSVLAKTQEDLEILETRFLSPKQYPIEPLYLRALHASVFIKKPQNKINHAPPHIDLPLSSLLRQLQTARFQISPAIQLRLQEALQALSESYKDKPQELKYVLAPLVAVSGEEQQRFYQIFDQWLGEGMQEKDESPPPPTFNWIPWMIGSALALLIFAIFYFNRPVPKAHTFFQLPDRCIRMGEEIILRNLTPPLQSDIFGNNDEKSLRFFPFVWDFGDGNTNNQDTLVRYRYESPGYKTIQLTAGDSTYQQTIFVAPSGRASAAFSYTPDKPKQGDLITFRIDSVVQGYDYVWDFGNGDTPLAWSVIRRFEKDDQLVNLTVSLAADSMGFCSASHTANVLSKDSQVPLPELKPKFAEEIQDVELSILSWLFIIIVVTSGLRAILSGPIIWSEITLGVRKQKQPGLKRGKEPPYRIPLAPQGHFIQSEPDFYSLSDALRKRESSSLHKLDIPASLKAMIRKGGFPDFQYKRRSRPLNI